MLLNPKGIVMQDEGAVGVLDPVIMGIPSLLEATSLLLSLLAPSKYLAQVSCDHWRLGFPSLKPLLPPFLDWHHLLAILCLPSQLYCPASVDPQSVLPWSYPELTPQQTYLLQWMMGKFYDPMVPTVGTVMPTHRMIEAAVLFCKTSK